MVKQFSLTLMDHQITHLIDDIDEMEIELLFHKWSVIIIISNGIINYIIK